MRKLLMSILIAGAAALAALAVMLLWPAGGSEGKSLSFDRAARGEQADLPRLDTYRGEDGAELFYRFYPAETETVFILVHGSGYHGAYLHELAAALADAGAAQVAVPNMRGHHASGPARGDIGHIGQLEEDLGALMAVLRGRVADARFALGGHSSGGGFALRMAAGAIGRDIAGLVLIAPYLGHDAATSRARSGGWANPDIPRIIALSILNGVGVTAFNGLTALTFTMPESARDGTETLAYSYRLMTAFGPSRTLESDIAGLSMPALVIAGADDEAMVAKAYEPLFAGQPDADAIVIGGAGHLGIVSHGAAIGRIEAFLNAL